MTSPDKAPTAQPEFVFCPAVLIPQGEGTYLMKPGKPVEWLSVRNFAAAVGLGTSTIRDHLGTDLIPDDQIRHSGVRRIFIKGSWVAEYTRLSKGKHLAAVEAAATAAAQKSGPLSASLRLQV